ncbi:unnamed protein product [Cylicocyclus nassatus]|uniref:Uncharacterized protein n=1 Tax=Cylicocyclus nassatus TaxID=53992 RepID=A0AA36HF32_CYLNA|nr:unnamed protein product [Cylicocyclus nassatus]
MDHPIGLVRDNPFVKNDLCMRARSLPNSLSRRPAALPKVPSSNTTLSGAPPALRTLRPVDQKKDLGKSSSTAGAMDDNHDTSSLGSGSELEYGPGIVERLKAKFHRLSGLASRDAKVSPHATGKRCPSVDDILSTAEEEPLLRRTNTAMSGRSSASLSPLSKRQSHSTGDMLDAVDDHRTFVVHRTINLESEEFPDKSISALRRKFEINVQRRPSQNLRHVKNLAISTYESRSLPTSVDFSHRSSAMPMKRDITSPLELRMVETSRKSVTSPTTDLSRPFNIFIPEEDGVEKDRMLPLVGSERYMSPVVPLTASAPKMDLTHHDYQKPFRVLEVLNQATVIKRHDKTEEPEFVRIGRRIRKNSANWEDFEQIRSPSRERGPTLRVEKGAKPLPEFSHSSRKVPFVRRRAEVPNLTRQASIVTDDFYETSRPSISSLTHSSARSLDMMSPPDPDSARQRSTDDVSSKPTVFIRTDDLPPAMDASPPPEEPRPPQHQESIDADHEYILRGRTPEVRSPSLPPFSSPPVIPRNMDDTGVTEMQRLLTRFRKERDERHLGKIVEPLENDSFSEQQRKPLQERPPVHTVVGVRPSLPPANRPLFVHRAVNLSRPNVVNISVKGDTPTLLAKRYDDDDSVDVSPSVPSTIKTPSTSPTSWTAPVQQEAPRKSLSAKYIEEKSKTPSPITRQNFDTAHHQAMTHYPHFAKSPELLGERVSRPTLKNNEESSSDNDDEEHHPLSGLPPDLDTVIIAGDGNPVRHSLLSLVMEEDIPALMEAMSEKYTCEFEDLDESRPSTSSILHAPETRKERRKARQVSSIRFEETKPKVYTYLDEGSAIDKNKWEEGVHVDYETYQNIIASEVEEYKKSVAELQKWKENIAAQAAEVGLTHDDDSLQVNGVTSRFDFSPIHNDNSTICLTSGDLITSF